MIKIAHLNNISQLSGSQLVSIEVLDGLPSSLFKKTIICGIDSDGKQSFEQRCINSGIENILIKSSSRSVGLGDLIYFVDLVKIFRKEKYDIVHTNSSKQGLLGRIAAKIAGTKIVLHTVHGIAYHKHQFFLKRIILYLFELFGTFFCDHQILVNTYYSKYYNWIPWLKSTTIKNGVSSEELDNYLASILEKKYLQNQNKKNVLFLGRLESQKDPLTLLKAVKFLKDNYPQIFSVTSFRFVGDGILKSVCLEFAQENNIISHVNFPGWSDNKWEELLNADILCVPSIHEACGLVFLEAGLCKIPVVATNTEGIPEVVIHRETGLLGMPYDHIGLAKNLLELLTNESLSIKLGNQGRKYVIDNYMISEMKENYLEFYNKMINKILFPNLR